MSDTKYLRYLCPHCNEKFISKWAAASCCPREVDSAYFCPECQMDWETAAEAEACEAACVRGDAHPLVCTVCHEHHDTVDHAVDCCLWKTHSFFERYQLARQLEATIY